MKKQSLHFKFLIILIAAMMAVTVFIGGMSVYEVDQFIQRETENFVRVTCEKEAAEINDIFGDMEKSVNIMSSYVLDFSDSVSTYADREVQNEIIESTYDIFDGVAENTIGTVAYYLRFAVEISDSTTGIFISKTTSGDEFIRHEVTDLSIYDRNDTEHVGWYWQPYDAGKAIWMKPYHNQNNNFTMISYVVPMYCEGEFIGIVGMDFDYNVLLEKINGFKIYENGFAHLEQDGIPLHNRDMIESSKAEDYLRVSVDLINDMTLVASVSYSDIRQIRYDIALRIVCITLILSVGFCLIGIFMVKRIVKPLKKLTEASKKLANRNYDIEPIHSDTYEIQLLSAAFENMAMNLREHEKLQYLLAYRDSMTGLRNTTSYKVWVTDFDKEIQNKSIEFGVIVLDVNYLKETNDKYGHDVGNKLIIAVGQLISGVFKRSPVFRIGGDEFLVILRNRDLEEHEALCEKLDTECRNEYIESNGNDIPISIARGFAKYDPDKDTQFVDVFNRADDAMYKRKREMKSSAE